MNNEINPADYPGIEFCLRYSDLYEINTRITSWHFRIQDRISKLEEELRKSERSKKKSARIIRIINRQKKISTRRFSKMTALADQLRIDVAKEQAKYISNGYTFMGDENRNSWGSAIFGNPKPLVPIHTGICYPIIENEKSPMGIKIPITFEKNTREIKIGLKSIKVPLIQYLGDNSPISMLNIAINENGLNLPYFQMDYMALTKVRAWLYGTKPDKYLRNLSSYLWASESNDLINKFCRHGKGWSSKLIIRFHEAKKHIDYLVKKNLEHLIPAAIFFNEDLTTIKEIVGSKTWNIIANNSISRNELIFRSVYKLNAFDYKESENKDCIGIASDHGISWSDNGYLYKKPHPIGSKRIIEFILGIPTSLLRNQKKNHVLNREYNYYINTEATKWMIKIAKDKKILGIKSAEVLDELKILYADTKQMAESIDAPFSDSWSHRTMLKKHQQYTRESALKNHVHVDFKFKKKWPEKIDHNGVTANLLKTSTCLLLEGLDLRHCVASYSWSVQNGHSIIYSLTHNDTGLRSTLEISFTNRGKTAYIRQNRGYYNKRIKNEDVAKLVDNSANEVLSRIQEILNSKKKTGRKMLAA